MPQTPAAKGRPLVLGLPFPSLVELAEAIISRETGDRYRLASTRIPPILVVDFEAKAIRSAGNETRSQGFGAQDGGSQPPVGRTPHSWRVTEIRNRDFGADGLPTDAQTREAAFPNLERLPKQLCPGFSLDGFLHGTDGYLSGHVCPGCAGSSPPAGDSLQRDGASDGLVDRAAYGGSLS